MKLAPVIAVVFGVGIGLGMYIQSQSEGESVPPLEVESETCQASGDIAVADVKSLSSDRDRNTEANKMLADLLKLFMVDVALRISDSNKQQMGQVIPTQKCPSKVISQKQIQKSPEDQSREIDEGLQTQQLLRVIKKERQARDLRNPSEEKDFVDGTAVDNMFPYMKNMAKVSYNEIQVLEGVFKGDIHTQDEKFPIWQMEYKMKNLKKSGEHLVADTSIVFKRNGEQFSNSSGYGRIDGHHKKFGGDSRAIILETGGGDLVLQLYLIANNQRIIGTLYKKKSVDEYIPYGTVRLQRQ